MADDLQFETVETKADAAQPTTCQACKQALRGEYWSANASVLCAPCATELRDGRASGSPIGRFLRAGLLGTLGGVAGALVWWGVQKLTGYEIGLVAILVGFLVGGGVRLGSRGRGGWLYQLMAVGLTYAAVAAAYAPFIAAAWREDPDMADIPGPVLALLAWFTGFVAPFLGGFENLIGLLIIGFALWQAWTMNRRVEIAWAGPYRLRPAVPSPEGPESSSGPPPLP